MEWMYLVKIRDRWRDLASNGPSGFIKCGEILWVAEQTSASLDGLGYTELIYREQQEVIDLNKLLVDTVTWCRR
jgi:hypothetical protein